MDVTHLLKHIKQAILVWSFRQNIFLASLHQKSSISTHDGATVCCGVEAEHFVPAMLTCIRKCKGGCTTAPPQGSYSYAMIIYNLQSNNLHNLHSTVGLYLPHLPSTCGQCLVVVVAIYGYWKPFNARQGKLSGYHGLKFDCHTQRQLLFCAALVQIIFLFRYLDVPLNTLIAS